MNGILKSFTLSALLTLLLLSQFVSALTNAERFARGLPPNPPVRRGSRVARLVSVPSSVPISTCTEITLTGLTIGANCPNKVVSASINDVVKNVRGQLKCQQNGGAIAGGCSGCSLSETSLTCNCLDSTASVTTTHIDINSCLLSLILGGQLLR
ncbi:hypothetical protein K435DRAFT_836536 [Dendrothele bispora CBS 962.96]|uniref:Cyanovirin-N domain-containing protein n=1 Tax=Dendrothele bispora (strain CBS 962.96) TaxID=1314807 RepID=A0A4S8MHL2_DENBC|nr:hypothetical protein K435DRAFT_836536 [Dendrothele bispora CBS 962.96]